MAFLASLAIRHRVSHAFPWQPFQSRPIQDMIHRAACGRAHQGKAPGEYPARSTLPQTASKFRVWRPVAARTQDPLGTTVGRLAATALSRAYWTAVTPAAACGSAALPRKATAWVRMAYALLVYRQGCQQGVQDAHCVPKRGARPARPAPAPAFTAPSAACKAARTAPPPRQGCRLATTAHL